MPKGSKRTLFESEILPPVSQEDLEDVELDSEDEALELEIAEAFFKMDENARKKIQEKVPIKIIERLKFRMSKEQERKRDSQSVSKNVG